MALVEVSRPVIYRSKRQAERKSTYATVQGRRGLAREAVEVLDISASGARVRTLAPLKLGQVMWLRLPRLEPIQARVVWTRNFESGCQFVRALHPAVFESLTLES